MEEVYKSIKFCIIRNLGTLDVCIAEIKNKLIELKAISGNSHLGKTIVESNKVENLGGQDFDGKLMKYAIDEFAKSSNYLVRDKPKLMKRLRVACKETKEALSFNSSSYNIHARFDSYFTLLK